MHNAHLLSRSFGLRPLFITATAGMLAACATARPPVTRITNNFDGSIAAAKTAVAAAKVNMQARVVIGACESAGETGDPVQLGNCTTALRLFYLANNDNPDLTPMMQEATKAGAWINGDKRHFDSRCAIKEGAFFCNDQVTEAPAAAPVLISVQPAARAPRLIRARATSPVIADVHEALDALREGPADKWPNFFDRNAPALAAGATRTGLGLALGLSGTKLAVTHGVALGAKSFIAYCAGTTLAPAIPTVVTILAGAAVGVFFGALIGGVTEVVKQKVKAKKDLVILPKNWWRREFKRGALNYKAMIIGGILGVGLGAALDYFRPHGYLHCLTHADKQPSQPNMPVQDLILHEPPMDTAFHGVNVADLVPTNVIGLLSQEQLHGLPQSLQKLAASRESKDIIIFCKEASFRLINGPHHNADSYKAAAKLIQRGLDLAKQGDIHNRLIDKLHADMAWLKLRGIGVDRNLCSAFAEADQSHHAINNFAGRLKHLLPKTAARCLTPAAG